MKKNLFQIILLLIAPFVIAQEGKEARLEHFNLDKGVAISGYDPVSYFSDNPAKGRSDISYDHNGIIYQFVSDGNKEKFVANPSKYEPVYGGWCAYAMGLDKAEKVSINPKTYKIIDGRLYLYYNKLSINTLTKWNKDEENYKNKADKNWSNITVE